ncbi:hypothetical protein HPB52_015916 [Rhipicephalus sanguineus]|uniref:VWFC domain-containing protein n=1 Tax=Rhipicephalus sanguineus TaxID=34632 RepID=A0A9D4SXK8_RHISA|nr:hypothetical protein HPB52_015916 [Rhipicephalus sanguineus]
MFALRCFYKSERYEHGDSVETPEPCLNCTCQKGVLVCYLRVCPTIGTPAPGCFTAREAGQCCPSVFCSGKPRLHDCMIITYSFAPRPFNRPHASGIDKVELSARTPSVIVEHTEQSTTAEVDVTTITTDLPSTTTTATKAAIQTPSEAATARRPVTTFTPTITTQQQSVGTSTTPEDVVVTVTAMGITPTATTSLPMETTTTALMDLSGSDHHDKVGVTTPSRLIGQQTERGAKTRTYGRKHSNYEGAFHHYDRYGARGKDTCRALRRGLRFKQEA